MSELTRDSALEFLADYITNNKINYVGGEFEREDNNERFILVVSKESALKNLTEENQRLTAIATKHATRADELHEALKSTNKELYFLINELNKYRTKDVRCDQLDPPELHDMETCHLNAILLDKSRIEAEKSDGICN